MTMPQPYDIRPDGSAPAQREKECSHCGGSGVIKMGIASAVAGESRVFEQACYLCHGVGKVVAASE